MKGKQKILIADDDADFVMLLKRRLEVEGFETCSASEGVRAIELAHRDHPDLILLDFRMPAGTGDFVLSCLRTEEETEKIPVIVLSGVKSANLATGMLHAGAEDFVVKPPDDAILMGKIHALLA